MTFEEALPLLKQGKRMRCAYWTEITPPSKFIQLVDLTTPDGASVQSIFMVWYVDDMRAQFVPWGGINRDILRDDWEMA